MPFLKKVHKWVGLLIGIQVFLWLLSGLVISLLDPAKVSGAYQVRAAPVEAQTLPSKDLLETRELAVESLTDALEITLEMNREVPVYRVRTNDGFTLLNASNGTLISVTRKDAESLALNDYSGDGRIISAKRGIAPGIETRGHQGAYWRVDFSDDVNTSLYISAIDGSVLERRNDYWRVHDFFWMLHIMDYRDREDFNHALIIGTALIAIWLGISGLLMLFGSFNRFDFQFLNVFNPARTKTVTVVDPENGSSRQLNLRQGANLFRSLASHGINLPSICGGGGDCGKCRVKLESDTLPDANPTEIGLVPKPLRNQGFRLACQHQVANNLCIHLPRKRQKHPAS